MSVFGAFFYTAVVALCYFYVTMICSDVHARWNAAVAMIPLVLGTWILYFIQ